MLRDWEEKEPELGVERERRGPGIMPERKPVEALCLSSSECLRTACSWGTAEVHGSLITKRHVQLIFRDRLDLPYPKPKAGKLPYLSLFNTLNITSRQRKKYRIWLSFSQTLHQFCFLCFPPFPSDTCTLKPCEINFGAVTLGTSLHVSLNFFQLISLFSPEGKSLNKMLFCEQ